MLYGHIGIKGSYQPYLAHPLWVKALEWLARHVDDDMELGEYEIQGRDVYATAVRTMTKPRDQCRAESHRQYIDLHYCVHGFERIEVSSLPLVPDTKYNEAQDVLLYTTPSPESTTSLFMIRGSLAVFSPPEAHMPLIEPIGEPGEIMKVVVKVRAAAVR